MMSVIDRMKNLVIYVDLDDNISGINCDDIVANPVCSLPKVFSPVKVVSVEKMAREKLSVFYTNLTKASDTEVHDSDSNDLDSIDNDYEIGNSDDDDLFVDNVDVGVFDEGASKGNKMFKWKKAEGSKLRRKQPMTMAGGSDDESTDKEEIDLADFGEGSNVNKFKPFCQQDLPDPSFRLGQAFDDVQLVSKAISEYSAKNRVEIHMPRNDSKRVGAHCAEGCPWNFYASWDSRTKCFLVKTYNGQHICQKKWMVKSCTSKWLAEKYLETFRADNNMTLPNFARTVHKEWNLTPSRTKLWRTRKLAMKSIHGDELKQYSQLWAYGQELRRSNPGSKFVLKLIEGAFSTCYLSLDACKRASFSGCRPIIFLDGCHLKTKFGGQLLTVVGMDPNDCIFPIVVAMVEDESLAYWK
jgi:hypothetical protein